MAGKDSPDDTPTLRQVLHAATGDRRAEAEALADRAGDVDVDAAEVAVRRAHGDIDPDREPEVRDGAESHVAGPVDAVEARDEREVDEP